MSSLRPQALILLALFVVLPASAQGAFSITTNVLFGLSPSQRALLDEAVAEWESIVTGYQPGISLTGITITIIGQAGDGPGGNFAGTSLGPTTSQGGYTLAQTATIIFDSFDIGTLEADGRLITVMLHEIPHALGFGLLWDDNGLYTVGTGQYLGAHGLAAYRREFDPAATFVPVETAAGGADAHWDEAGATPVVVDPSSPDFGQSLDDSLMSSIVSGSSFLTRTTLATLRDIGFTIIDSDGDRIPDSYELARGLDPEDPADAATDPDGDGTTARAEFHFGTDENDPASVFTVALTSVDVAGSGSLDVTYGPVFAGLTYQATDSTNGIDFDPLGAPFAPGAGAPTHSEPDAGATAAVKCYRVEVTGNELP